MKKSQKLVLGGLLVSIGIVLSAAGGLVVYRLRKTFRRDVSLSEDSTTYEKGRLWASQHKDICERLTRCVDDVELVGYYYNQEAEKSVLLVHGLDGTYLDRLADADFYFSRGFNVLSVMCRGHAESGGEVRTMGYKDCQDVIVWAQLLAEEKQQKEIVLDGISMGGASVLAASADDALPAQVMCVISECSFTSLYDIVLDMFQKTFPFGATVAMPLIEWYCRHAFQISFRDHAPITCVPRAKVPILLIHGTEDTIVPFPMGQKLYDACGNTREFFPVEGAGHCMASQTDPRGYAETLDRFIREQEACFD